jgi:DNA-damage-inducible protein J
MAKTAVVRSRVDEDLKKNTQDIFKRLGISMSDAISMFLQQCAFNNGIPFKVEIPNAETRQAIDDSINGIGNQEFNSMEEMFEELDKDE